MFGLSFSEIIIIALVAIIVIGPERLPKTARTLGLLMGRAQRYVNDIKSDIEREMHVEDIKKFKDEVASSVSKAKSSVEGEITSITNPIKSITNPLDTVKSEVNDLEKQLKGSLNPLPDLDSLKLDEAASKAAAVPLTEAPKAAATTATSRSAAAVTAGAAPAVEAKPAVAAGPEAVASAVPELSVAHTASASTSVPLGSAKSFDSTVAEALIYPDEDDDRLASGTEVVKQRWMPSEPAETDVVQAAVPSAQQQVAGIYDGPSFEPLVAPEPDADELKAQSAAWDSYVAEHASPIDADRSLEGLSLWEQKPDLNKQPDSKPAQHIVASDEADNKNNSSSDKGGSNV
ncbi:Sec-independent protein translocase protein TatB [Oligella sp. MSHR50489EDL]|uniref:Sec-independent protein translocase protein TatB n=1 Tax=Oligella sp. MSHR50489EDL TaxID=3139409 RepID=UPI003D8190E9